MAINFGRVMALFRRYMFIYFRNSFRILDIFFWPIMDLLVWGWVSTYLTSQSNGLPSMVTFLIGAIIMFNVLYRSQQGITVAFLEDVWSRNLLNIFAAPVRASEFVAATYIVGLAQSVLVLLVMAIFAYFAYSFDLMNLGTTLLPFFANLLIMGWSLGLFTTALILRYGNGAEPLAWAVPFLIQPLSAVFYPVSILPDFLQPLARCLPSTHVFEGMRGVLQQKRFPADELLYATGLNIIYMLLSAFFFAHMFSQARKHGLFGKLVT
jgi:ABC-2 type transporter.